MEKDLQPDFGQVEEENIAGLLRQFYGEMASKEGRSYSKSSILGIRAAIQRHFTGPEVNRNINIVSGPAFRAANDVITGILRDLKKEGEDKSKSHPPISELDLKQIYSTKTLSDDTPSSLQLKIFFEVCLHFGRRGREGLRELKKDQVVFLYDDTGVEYATLGFNPQEKNRQGYKLKEIEHDQRMYGTGAPNCPLVSLKKYINALNPASNDFFQRPKPHVLPGEEVWYINSPVGVNTIGQFMPKICTLAGLKNRYTNHSIRATTVTSLRHMGVHVNDIMAVTGHKCAQRIMSYSTTSNTVRRDMSHNLSVAAGYSIKKASPVGKGEKKQPSAALGKAPPIPSVTTVVKTDLSSPDKSASVAVTVTPTKIKGEMNVHVDTQLIVKEALEQPFEESPNRIPCSQIAPRTDKVKTPAMVVNKVLFPSLTTASFHGYNFYVLDRPK